VAHEHAAAPLAERLRAQGLRLTPQRQQVLAAAPDTSTVYRTLELLERLGLVWHTHLGKGAPVYHASEHPHLHVVCASCGEISSADPALLEAAAERLVADLGFTLDVGHVALSGTCRRCRETGTPQE
jgi:Fur family ferric uptake transcriptional regulator